MTNFRNCLQFLMGVHGNIFQNRVDGWFAPQEVNSIRFQSFESFEDFFLSEGFFVLVCPNICSFDLVSTPNTVEIATRIVDADSRYISDNIEGDFKKAQIKTPSKLGSFGRELVWSDINITKTMFSNTCI